MCALSVSARLAVQGSLLFKVTLLGADGSAQGKTLPFLFPVAENNSGASAHRARSAIAASAESHAADAETRKGHITFQRSSTSDRPEPPSKKTLGPAQSPTHAKKAALPPDVPARSVHVQPAPKRPIAMSIPSDDMD